MDTVDDDKIITLDDLLRIPAPHRREPWSQSTKKKPAVAEVDDSPTAVVDSLLLSVDDDSNVVARTKSSSAPFKPVSLGSLFESDPVFRKSDEEVFQDASIDWVFTGKRRPATSQGLSSRKPRRKQPLSRNPKPLRFVDKTISLMPPPTGLTYNQVPRDRDSQFKYCGACLFADLHRCQYCHASKLSKEHRLALPRLASLLIQRERFLGPSDLATKLAKYARNDEYCRLLNFQLGWQPTPQSTCSAHLDERSAQEENDEQKKKQIEALTESLAKSASTISQLNSEIEALRNSTSNSESRNADLSAQLRQAQSEAMKMAEQSKAQSCVITCMRDELNAKPQTVDCELQTTAWAEIDREIQTVALETSDDATQTTIEFVIEREVFPGKTVGFGSEQKNPSASGFAKTQSGLAARKRTKRENKLIPLQSLLDMIHEVVEKKTQNTQAAVAAGKQADCLVEYVKIFWREKLGLRKLANKKVGEMIHAVKAYSKQHSRVRWFAVILGVKTEEDDLGDKAPWVPWIAASTFDLLAQTFDNGAFKPVVERHRVVNAIIGSSGVLDATVRLNDPSTWKPPSLREMMDPVTLTRLVEEIFTLTEVAENRKSGINTDDFLKVLLRYQLNATVRHQKALTAAFHRFDGGEPGLDPEEFERLLTWAVMPEKPPEDVDALYERIETLADANLLADENDRNINDSLTFPIVIMQHVPSCPLALAMNCRLWWTLDDETDTQAPP